MKKLFTVIFSTFLFCSLGLSQSKEAVLIEAESFPQKGGWLVDQQFMDQMGSPFLLAHGLGKPVENAKTAVKLPKKGQWHVYVRTWDWCSPWSVEGPGVFKVAVNGQQLENTLGKGKQWGWEYAGSFNAAGSEVSVELCDLSGFEGRCDAIVLAKNQAISLPNDLKGLQAFRKKLLGLPAKPKSAGQFDLVIVGGGLAGIVAGVKASREGLKVAVIHDRPVPGGNNSVEMRIPASGRMNIAPYVKLGNVTGELKDIYLKGDNVYRVIEAESGLSYYPNMHMFAVKMDGSRIVSVTAKHIESSEELEFSAPVFADCSGDGNLGYLAGAEYLMGREMRANTRETLAPDKPDNMVLGASTPWATKVMEDPVSFPVCDWAIQFNEDSCEKVTKGSNWWEAGFWHDQISEAEFIRDYLFRAIYGNWAFLKNKSKDKEVYAKLELAHLSHIAGKRESRRLIGDVFFVQQDIEGNYVKYDDAIVYGSYSIDQHFPTPKNSFYFPKEEFFSTMKHYFNDLGTPGKYLRKDQLPPPYRIPYRCLYSVNVDNMFMAGRDVSVSHIALASTRVGNVAGQMGEVVAVAAKICKKYSCTPREVYTMHLQELLDAFK